MVTSAGFSYQVAKKVPDQLLVCGIREGSSEGPEWFQTDSK